MSIKPLAPLSPKTDVSANAENPQTVEVNTSASPISTNDLLALIVSLQKQNADANAALAAAIIKTTEPRAQIKDAKQLAHEANEKLFDDNAKELTRRQKQTIRANQDNCVHIAGCSELSEQKDIAGRTSILWHINDAQVKIGICTVCQRYFHPSDPPDAQGHTYQFWAKQSSFNKISRAGIRQFMDPRKAMEDSYLHDS